MVLWEITVATAYFLGLRRTYRLALKLQRRIVGPKHPKIRQFLHGRTRAVFDVAVKVHKNIQERDIELGRNFGNWILRWLDKMKPSAGIRGLSPEKTKGSPSVNINRKQVTDSSHSRTPGSSQASKGPESGRHLFTASRNTWQKSMPSISAMIRPPQPVGSMTQYRHFGIRDHDTLKLNLKHPRSSFDGVIRKDIMQWMLQQ